MAQFFLSILNPIKFCPGVSYNTFSKFFLQSDSFVHPPHQHRTNHLLSLTNTCLRALYFSINMTWSFCLPWLFMSSASQSNSHHWYITSALDRAWCCYSMVIMYIIEMVLVYSGCYNQILHKIGLINDHWWLIQNGMDKMVYGQNVIGWLDKMVWTKLYGQNGTNKTVPIKSTSNLSIPFPLTIWFFHQSRFHLDPFTFPLCA